ncbi:MAG: Sapep family Mn(2+)-dependent dipeptidase [Lachnospiraceae bacterium]|nr:Sapep family Mn(2+)-dependent dipeptidase [Lachnospiraceae bacterium]
MYKDQIAEFIMSHRDEMLKDIGDLIRINSEKMPARENMPYGEGPYMALKLAMEKARGYGFRTTNYDNYVGAIDMGSDEAQLDILAHLDVVPVTPEGWTVTGPFEPKVVGDRLYGRGSCDDKGPAMAAFYAMRCVKELGIPLKKRVRLLLGTDEECGSSDIAYYYAKEKEAPMTFSPDAEFPVINLEKGHYVSSFEADFADTCARQVLAIASGTKFNVIPEDAVFKISGLDSSDVDCMRAQAGDLGVALEISQDGDVTTVAVKGKGGHAAFPEGANNALTAAISIICGVIEPDCDANRAVIALGEMFPHGDYLGESAGVKMSDDISGDLTISLNMIELDGCRVCATFDSRYPVCGTVETTADVLERNGLKYGLRLTSKTMTKPHYVDPDSDFIRTLLADYEMYKNKPARCVAIGGGTYVHNLKNGVAYGPAEFDTVNNMHGNDENVPIEELTSAACIYAQVIIDLCS